MRHETERRIRTCWERQAYQEAAEIAIRTYGPEIMSYLVALAPDLTCAGDSFSVFAEDLWRALPSFRWECELRSFAYGLARNALLRVARDPYRRRASPLSQAPEAYAEQIRTTTAQHLRTETKDRVARLREQLDPQDRELLILRVDRGLSWQEVARILCEDEPAAGETAQAHLARNASRLRKRFERVKETLRRLVTESAPEEE